MIRVSPWMTRPEGAYEKIVSAARPPVCALLELHGVTMTGLYSQLFTLFARPFLCLRLAVKAVGQLSVFFVTPSMIVADGAYDMTGRCWVPALSLAG